MRYICPNITHKSIGLLETYSVDSQYAHRIIRQLALEWIQSRLPAGEITYVDCLKVLSRLQTSTQDIQCSEAIFEQVFGQAKALEKDSEWMARELGFEALAQSVVCRADLALLYLKQDDAIDDDALDLYNERLARFQTLSF